MLIARPFPSIHESYTLTLLDNEFSVRIPNLPSVRRALNHSRSSVVSFALSTGNDGSKERTQKGTKEELPENRAARRLLTVHSILLRKLEKLYLRRIILYCRLMSYPKVIRY